MTAGEDDLGLELRLPWGRPERAADAPAPRRSSAAPAQPAATPADIVAAVDDLRRRVDALIVSVEERLQRVEKRLHQVAFGLPRLLAHVEADMASQQAATVKAVGELRDVPLVNQLEDRMDLVASELTRRLERIESLLWASEGLESLAGTIPSEPPRCEPPSAQPG